MKAGESTRVRLVFGLAGAALRERLRSARSSRRLAVLGASASAVVALGLVAAATNGFGMIAASVPTTPAQSVLLHLGPGRAQATSSMPEPKGVTVMASISAPRGIDVSADANIVGTANVEITTVRGAGSALSCRTHGSENVCTEALEWCPMPAASWSRCTSSSKAGQLQRVASFSSSGRSRWGSSFESFDSR